MALRKKALIQSLASLLFLLLFVYGMGHAVFFPSLRLLQDTPWDLSFFPAHFFQLLSAILWVIPMALGFLGWNRFLRMVFYKEVPRGAADLLGLSTSLALFSLFVLGLAVNGIFYWPLTVFFFVVGVVNGWREWKEGSFLGHRAWKIPWIWMAVPPALIWVFEYLSPPLVWDAVLDHFRYAREISRLHQIPFQWVNHTGDMPKAAELVLAGFWNLGGETLSKLALGLPVLLTLWLLGCYEEEGKTRPGIGNWIFITCPYFLALYAFGYIEGFLAFYEVLALFCIWRATQERKKSVWSMAGIFFLGFALSIKYTAVLFLGVLGLLWIYGRLLRGNGFKLAPGWALVFGLPVFPWLFKNCLAFDDPFYPLATSWFGAGVGYSPELEKGLWVDTGVPWGISLVEVLKNLWNVFFTSSNAVNAAWTPLFVMGLPWVGSVLKKPLGCFLGLFSVLFFAEWLLVSSSFRHASGGALVLVLLAVMMWNEAFREKGKWAGPVFGLGAFLSCWLCFTTQLTTTAPYASALGLEDPLARLKRHYSYDMDTYRAYRYMEEHSGPRDKVMAFAVFQTYPLRRTAFVDFKWKRPIFLEWASRCQTAEQLAKKLQEEGVVYFLYQRWEANAMSRVEKDFNLEGMPLSEYRRFWVTYMEQELNSDNIIVYRVLASPQRFPAPPVLPGLKG